MSELLTLSSMVSNLVSTIPSIRWGFWADEWSAMAWLNFTSWSTASLPTKASPTNNTKSGSFTFTNCQQPKRHQTFSPEIMINANSYI